MGFDDQTLEGRDTANDFEVARYNIGKRPARALGREPHTVEAESSAEFEHAATLEKITIERVHPSHYAGGAARGQSVPSRQELIIRQVDQIVGEHAVIDVV